MWGPLKLFTVIYPIIGLVFVSLIYFSDPKALRISFVGDWLLWVGLVYSMMVVSIVAAYLIEKKLMGWKYNETFFGFVKTKWSTWE